VEAGQSDDRLRAAALAAWLRRGGTAEAFADAWPEMAARMREQRAVERVKEAQQLRRRYWRA
jgi:hypothetical protein